MIYGHFDLIFKVCCALCSAVVLFSHNLMLHGAVTTLLDGTNVRLNWNIESDLNVYWIKFKNFLSLY